MIDQSTIDRIYAAADIVEIIGDYVTLKKKGVNYQACCPFHQEKTPSFVVSPSKGFYKCFGCGKGGNAISFVMEQESVSYPEALRMVAKRYGIQIEEREQTKEDVERQNNRESMFALNSWAADYFARYLSGSVEGRSVGMSYLAQKRGFTDATIRKFGLGFCPAGGDDMTVAALQAGYKEEFLLSTGLSLKRDGDGRLRDRFRDRVIFPVHNISGRVVAFGGRTLRTDKQVAKYQNSPESEIYSKRRELYGLYFAKKAIQQLDSVIMVEGYTDVISMHQAGVENVVSSSGTSLTQEQVQLLRRFTRNITVIYDGDAAGQKASLRGIDIILQEGMNVRVVMLPEPEDPDSFARAHSAEEFQQYIRQNEEDFLSFKAKLLMRDAERDPIRRGEVIKDIVQTIALIPDAIQRSVFVKECSKIMQADERTLQDEVARVRLGKRGGNDAELGDFMRRQQAEMRREQGSYGREPMQAQYGAQPSVTPDLTAPITAGSSEATLETEIAKYLIKSGHLDYEQRDGHTIVAYNVADYIFSCLDEDDIVFSDSTLREIVDTYRREWERLGLGVEVPAHYFTNHADVEVCNLAIQLLTSEEQYVASQLWQRKEIHVESESELLSVGVPKVMLLYKSKVVDRLIAAQNERLANPELSEEEETECVRKLAQLNQVKLRVSKLSQRNIL